MIAFTRPFVCQVASGLVAIAAWAAGMSTSRPTMAQSAASRFRAPVSSPLRYREYERSGAARNLNPGGGLCQSYVPGGVHDSSSLIPSGSKKKIAW